MADLLESSVKQMIELDPGHDHTYNMRRITQNFRRWRAPGPSDQYPCELIDTIYRRAWIVHRGRDCLQCNIDDLQYAKFDILLQRTHWPDIDRGSQFRAA